MAIILRGDKGAALTHTELDNNFRQFYYSASVSGTTLSLFTSASLANSTDLPMNPPSGYDYYVQFKKGNKPSGSEATLSGSANFLYDFRQETFKHTGSFINVGNATVDGDLTVTGTVTAQEMRTEFNNSSVVFESGSTKFGDTSDDTHSFTGSLELQGSLTSSADIQIAEWGSVSASLASDLQFAFNASASLAADLTSTSSSLATRIQSGSDSVQATYLRNTTDTLAGNLTVTGRINATEISTTYVTSSILYNSGSNIFGDAASDVHIFTGSIVTEQSITGSDMRIDEWGSISSSFASLSTTVDGLSTSYPDLQNIPSGIVSASVLSVPPVQGKITLATNGVDNALSLYKLGQGDSPSFADLTLNNFSSVSASLASLVAGTITINNDANNRVITANGDSTLNGETNLLFDGTSLTVSDTIIGNFNSGDTDVTGLLGGTTAGSLIEGLAAGHMVIGVRDNEASDSFAIIAGGGDYYSNTTYDKLLFQTKADGSTTIGGNTQINGTLDVTGDITAYSTSDERLKDNITPIPYALEKLHQINGVTWDWNDKSEKEGNDVGVIAQDIEKVLPQLVTTRDTGFKAVRYEKIVALLIEAVKEQQTEINELRSTLQNKDTK